MGTNDQDVMVQLAELRLQMSSMAASVDEIKSSVKEVITLDRTIAELSIHYQQQAKEIQTQWGKTDDNQREIEKVERKADEWINKGRGAWSTAVLLGSIAQIAILAMIAWTFNHVRSAEDDVLLMKAKLAQIEQQIQRGTK